MKTHLEQKDQKLFTIKGKNSFLTSITFLSFMRNPGYILKVGKPTNLIFKLKSLEFMEYFINPNKRKKGEKFPEPPCLNICVFEIKNQNKFEIVYEDDEYMPIPWGFTSELIKIKPNKYGYLILCLNYKKGYLGEFELEMFAD